MQKKIKYYYTTDNERLQNFGYFETIWDDCGGFRVYKRDFLKYFPTNKRQKVQENLNKVYDIYNANYAFPDGFLDNMFYAFFRDSKLYAQFKRLLTAEKFNKQRFWDLGIL